MQALTVFQVLHALLLRVINKLLIAVKGMDVRLVLLGIPTSNIIHHVDPHKRMLDVLIQL